MSDVTQLLNAIEAGEPKAADQLLPLVYECFGVDSVDVSRANRPRSCSSTPRL